MNTQPTANPETTAAPATAPQTCYGPEAPAAFTASAPPGAAYTTYATTVPPERRPGARMEDRSTWPLDVLPLRRDNPNEIWPELGLLINGAPIVYLANAFEPGLSARLKTCPTEVYPTFEALRTEGRWVID